MRIRLIHVVLILSLSALRFLCVNPQPLPQRLNAPRIQRLDISGVQNGFFYDEAIRISWTPPDNDSIGISSYTLLRSYENADSGFSAVIYEIPSAITSFSAPLSEQYRTITDIRWVYFRVFAIDSLDQPGDTSRVDSIALAPSPHVTYPYDTLSQNKFEWQIADIRNPFRSYITLWDTSGKVWQSDSSQIEYGNGIRLITFSRSLPDSLWPLHEGTWFVGATCFAIGGSFEQSIRIRRTYVPSDPSK